jgi:hypothetical protein
LLLVVGANAWALAYVSAERFVYFWDWGHYWTMFQDAGRLLRSDALAAFTRIGQSIAEWDYNLLPIAPLLPFEAVFGPGRLSYIIAITNVALLPSAALMALVAARPSESRSWTGVLLCTAGLLCLHVLWAPALRGLPDVLGVALASTILLVHFSEPAETHRPAKIAMVGLLLCLLILTRRYYLFWAASFYPAAMLAYLLGTPRAELTVRRISAVAARLALNGIVCAGFLLILAAPLLMRMASTSYSTAYAAYRPELVGAGPAGQVVAHFGIALLAVCAAGLGWLAVRRETRRLGIFLAVQALLAFCLFESVQGLFGVQHYYLLVPAAGVGLAAVLTALWNSRLRTGWRALGVGGVLAVVLLSSVAVFSPSYLPSRGLLPSTRYPPLVREDLQEVDRLLAAVAALEPKRVYVAASSEVLNWGVLGIGCRDRHPDLCKHVFVTPDIDTRDGFPETILEAGYVVLATPTQYHVRPEDQRIVEVVARDVRDGAGIGASFERLAGEFNLARGVKVHIYRRVAPLRSQDVQALREELARHYPRLRSLFDRQGA